MFLGFRSKSIDFHGDSFWISYMLLEILLKECVDHLFFDCSFTVVVWNWLQKWSRLFPFSPRNRSALLTMLANLRLSKKGLKLRCALSYCYFWAIWETKNDILFKNACGYPMKKADDIQLISIKWLKHMSCLKSLDWINWCCSPIFISYYIRCWMHGSFGGKMRWNVEVGINFDLVFKIHVGNSQNTLLWIDNWMNTDALNDRFPLLFKLDKGKFCFLSERQSEAGLVWDWKRKSSSVQELTELAELEVLVLGFSPSDQRDCWSSRLSCNGICYVRHLRALIDSKLTSVMPNSTIWTCLV
uniref:Reverse transcriptase zinc-binding domain-containing protein n=1 Tax=Lactuca sativa TaxID=4236 RepID=A0A9R1X0N9_LACSA|nr:hypothetical protein LSAT_V11C700354620 [Lactuca sativa]